MASTLIKNDVHIIFHVKSTGQTIKEEHLDEVFRYVGGLIKNLQAIPLEIGGRPDHLHVLCSLPATIALADFVRTIKAGSSKWIKSHFGCYRDFAWQEGYGCFSVSISLIDKTRNYIQTQKQHHQKRSFKEEYKAFLDRCGIDYDERYAFAD